MLADFFWICLFGWVITDPLQSPDSVFLTKARARDSRRKQPAFFIIRFNYVHQKTTVAMWLTSASTAPHWQLKVHVVFKGLALHFLDATLLIRALTDFSQCGRKREALVCPLAALSLSPGKTVSVSGYVKPLACPCSLDFTFGCKNSVSSTEPSESFMCQHSRTVSTLLYNVMTLNFWYALLSKAQRASMAPC